MIDPDEIIANGEGLDFKAQFLVEKADKGWRHEAGWVGESELAEAFASLDPATTAVMICSPGAMTVALADRAAGLGVPLQLVHYERFDYSGGRRSRKDWMTTGSFWAMALAVLAAGTLFALR